MVYLKSVVITLGKLIGLLFLFCLPLLSILFFKTKRNDLPRPVMGTIFLVYYIGYSLRGNYFIRSDVPIDHAQYQGWNIGVEHRNIFHPYEPI